MEKLFSRFYSSLMRRYVHKDFPYKGLETVLISRKVTDALNLNIESNSSFLLQVMSMGFRNRFINIDKAKRQVGRSKWSVSKKVKLFIDSFVAFSYAPIRFVTVIGFVLFALGFLWAAYLTFRKLVYDDLASGWPALVSILMTGFGITNISLGIIAEYLWRTLDASRKRPVFIVDEVTKLNSQAARA